MTTTETGADIGARITAQKKRSGLSWDRINKGVYDRLGAYTPHSETIRAWGRGDVNPEKIDPLVVTALADVFQCTVADISTSAAARVRALEAIRNRVDIDLTGGSDDTSGQGTTDFPWNRDPRSLALVGA